MIQFEANNWEEAWVQLHRLYAEQPEIVIDRRFATRAVSFNNILCISNNEIGGLSINKVGYTQYKVNLFDYRYVIPGMKEKILQTFFERLQANRKLSVVSYPFKEDDGAHHQGPCLVNMIITISGAREGWKAEFDIYARIGEITRRLMVDFMKFKELIDYFIEGLSEFKVELDTIRFHSKVLYAESISLTIAEHLFDFNFDKDHWLHRDVQKKIARFHEGDIKFKRGRRIRKAMMKLKENRKDEAIKARRELEVKYGVST